jgi:hypothetical protein
MSIPKQGNSCLRFPGRYGLQRDKVFHAKLDIVDTLMDISTNASNDGPTPNDADPRQFSCGLIGIAIGGFLFFRYTTPNWRSFKKLSAIVVSGGAHSLKSATGGYAMGIYGLPIDLEALKDECTAIARHHRRATQLVCGSGTDARLRPDGRSTG